ncbi:MAG TPA: isoaspartyl peptidase/L-asparaginase [Polyangiaceae bacterium]|nr:isoaspartyl peptidase/L-asparaginase [Polyangiaceae bacterium]
MTDLDTPRVTASWGADGGRWAVLVHGGAGDVPVERVSRHIEGCRAAAALAAQVLRAGGTALDAVERAVMVMEDDPCFNAGTGASLNADGFIELDAALMEGRQLRAGAVCALPPFLHPVAVARKVLEEGRHVLYAADGAARFALEHGFARATAESMTTQAARERWEASRTGMSPSEPGTVGAVARDAMGTVAAATSTGGLANKRAGRVGDSALLGAGTYADDDGGAGSATGLGEAIMRVVLAKTAIDAMRARIHPEDAARAVIRSMSGRVGGSGGIILADKAGRLGLARSTGSMTWAAAGAALPEVAGC